MARQSIHALTSTFGSLNVTGQAFKGPSYYGFMTNLITVQWFVKDFTGRIYVEGTVADTPTSTDWFPISLNNATNYIQYPLDASNPSGNNGGDTCTNAYSFSSNLTWIRIRLDRSYLTNPNVNLVGSIEKALINF